MPKEATKLRDSEFWKRLWLLFLSGSAWIILSVLALWTMGAIYYHEFLPRWLSPILMILFLVSVVAVLIKIKNRIVSRAVVAGMMGLVYLSWILVVPRSDREWQDQHQKMADISIHDGKIQIRNLRHTRYKTATDYKTEYSDVDFQLKEVESVWFLVQRFTSLKSLGHTFLSFGIKTPNGRRFISVSVEVRCEPGEKFEPISSMFKQTELIYVFSDERDALGYRTHVREEDRVWMYRCNATPEQAQAMFVDIAKRSNQLREQPEFYHTLFNNCTNNIVLHANRIAEEPANYLDFKVMLPGYSAKPAYNLGLIGEAGESFAELQERSRIDIIARKHKLDREFSERIRGQ